MHILFQNPTAPGAAEKNFQLLKEVESSTALLPITPEILELAQKGQAYQPTKTFSAIKWLATSSAFAATTWAVLEAGKRLLDEKYSVFFTLTDIAASMAIATVGLGMRNFQLIDPKTTAYRMVSSLLIAPGVFVGYKVQNHFSSVEDMSSRKLDECTATIKTKLTELFIQIGQELDKEPAKRKELEPKIELLKQGLLKFEYSPDDVDELLSALTKKSTRVAATVLKLTQIKPDGA